MLITELSPSTAMAILPSSTNVKKRYLLRRGIQRITMLDCRKGLVRFSQPTCHIIYEAKTAYSLSKLVKNTESELGLVCIHKG
jgi:hypothetical protein